MVKKISIKVVLFIVGLLGGCIATFITVYCLGLLTLINVIGRVIHQLLPSMEYQFIFSSVTPLILGILVYRKNKSIAWGLFFGTALSVQQALTSHPLTCGG